jgi:hypothetical protein
VDSVAGSRSRRIPGDRWDPRAAGGALTRPLADTIVDTAAWLAQRDNAGAWKLTLSAAKERAIVEGKPSA